MSYRQVDGRATLRGTSSYSRHRRRGYTKDKCPCYHQLTQDIDTPDVDSRRCRPLCRGTAAGAGVHSDHTAQHLPALSPDTHHYYYYRFVSNVGTKVAYLNRYFVARDVENHVCLYLEYSYHVSDSASFSSAVYKSFNSIA